MKGYGRIDKGMGVILQKGELCWRLSKVGENSIKPCYLSELSEPSEPS